jgi:signal peptidase I
MNPTIVEGDRILVNKLAYDLKIPFTTWHVANWSQPQRGEIVVFFSPEEGTRLVKRCVAVPGDTLEVRDNRLTVNGQAIAYLNSDPKNFAGAMPGSWQASHAVSMETLGAHVHPVAVQPWMHNPHYNFGPVTLDKDKFFMMGDNRDNSKDSRYFGVVDRSLIVGRASAVALSVSWGGDFPYVHPRWGRFFSKLP